MLCPVPGIGKTKVNKIIFALENITLSTVFSFLLYFVLELDLRLRSPCI